MAAQAALITDTIIGMKRALRRETHDPAPDDPITQPTNRGNKLRENAKFVREGALGYIHPEEYYKQKIEHAGYTRYILQPNPVRYDSEGDELDEEDEDSEADAATAEENPFSEIAVENLLCPLKHPSELPVHPSMSYPYTSKALWNMTQAVEAKLRQERALLWRARNLHRQFLGDSNWIPCGSVETPADRWIFEPKIAGVRRNSSANRYDQGRITSPPDIPDAQKYGNLGSSSGPNSVKEPQVPRGEQDHTADDVEMEDPVNHGPGTVESNNGQTKNPKSEDLDGVVGDLPAHSDKVTLQANGHKEDSRTDHAPIAESTEAVSRVTPEKGDGKETADDGTAHADPGHGSETQEEDAEMQDGSSPEPPRRMTTRAQTNAANPQQEGESAANLSSLSNDALGAVLTPHPLFLVPDAVRPDANFGLPANEAEETRRLLWSYVQKQEETVRGFEHMLDSLLRACRMKDDVFEWCKAEGHLGEMSDGEDWYDREKWGLAEGEELKKGADEDEIETVDDTRTTGKRGRRRA
ncbi:hypothetical protein PHISCL_02045 [Aspergillus sclerotialis]|uniref:Transcriptional regulatory protein RXT2 N-terminal domain-containing protein n=1 Tax=Aspergillus sclerotialis TaxID=2070753 RepID=A0A3A2ZR51_9EURO|nr:hypothetical protein PHISCL_02045 [Aspergillus sclerotialis]